jgi:hypothetical protein
VRVATPPSVKPRATPTKPLRGSTQLAEGGVALKFATFIMSTSELQTRSWSLALPQQRNPIRPQMLDLLAK